MSDNENADSDEPPKAEVHQRSPTAEEEEQGTVSLVGQGDPDASPETDKDALFRKVDTGEATADEYREHLAIIDSDLDRGAGLEDVLDAYGITREEFDEEVAQMQARSDN